MSESDNEALFSVLRQSADPDCAGAIEAAVRDAPDRELCRINPLAFAAKHRSRRGARHRRVPARRPARPIRIVVERAVPRLRRRAGRGHDAQERKPPRIRLRVMRQRVTSRRSTRWSKSPSLSVRAYAASPPTVPIRCSEAEYYRQIFWGSGVDLPETLGDSLERIHDRFDRTAAG